MATKTIDWRSVDLEISEEMLLLATKAERVHSEMCDGIRKDSQKEWNRMIADWDDMAARIRLMRRKFLNPSQL